MSEFTDLLLQVFNPAQALLFIGLAGVDYIQVQYLQGRLSGITERVERVENQMLATDGGKDQE